MARSRLTAPKHLEERYTRLLLSAFGFVHQAYLDFLEPRLAEVARQDAFFPHSTELKLLFATLKVALRTRVVRAAEQIADAIDQESAKVIGDLIGIDVRSLGISHLVDAFREENLRLVTAATQDFADEVRDVFESAGVNGLRVEELRKKLQDRVDVSRSRAELIARDQVLKLNSQVNQTRQQKAGVTQYTWSTSRDERVRQPKPGKLGPDHASLEGQTFDWNNPPEVDTKTGRRAHPGQDFQCRCIGIPVIAELSDSGDTSDEG